MATVTTRKKQDEELLRTQPYATQTIGDEAPASTGTGTGTTGAETPVKTGTTTVQTQTGSRTPGVANVAPINGTVQWHYDPDTGKMEGADAKQYEVQGDAKVDFGTLTYDSVNKIFTDKDGNWMYQDRDGVFRTVAADNGNGNDNVDEGYTPERAAAAYSTGGEAAAAAYKKNHPDDFISTIGVDPAKTEEFRKKREQNEKARKRAALFRGLGTLVDMGIAAGHGNVYRRPVANETKYENNEQLIRAQEAAAEQQAAAERKAARDQYDKTVDDIYKKGGEAAYKADLKQYEQDKKDAYNKWALQFKAEVQKERDAVKAERDKAKTTSRSYSGRSSGGSGDKTTMIDISTTNGPVRVVKAEFDRYTSLLMSMIMNAPKNDAGKSYASVLRSMKLIDDKNKPIYVNGSHVPTFLKSGTGLPPMVDEFLSPDEIRELQAFWGDIVAYNGTTRTARATTSGSSSNGGRTSGLGVGGGSNRGTVKITYTK